MATIPQIKQQNEDYIRSMVAPGSITKDNDANMRDAVADELLNRGMLKATTTGGLAALSHDDTALVLVEGVGLFKSIASGAAADNDITFASLNAGWLWQKVIDATGGSRDKFTINANHTYQLVDGYMLDKIMIKPTVDQMAKVGLTNGGDEIMAQDNLLSGQWKTVQYDVVADGANKPIYFTGFDHNTTIIVFKRKI
jgi:hypothetical protein